MSTTTKPRTAAKKPQDRQSKKPTVKKIDGGVQATLHGVTVTVPNDALDDFELLDDLRALDVDKNASRLPGILRGLVGDDFQAVMDALRDPATGRVSVEAGMGFVLELFEAINPNS